MPNRRNRINPAKKNIIFANNPWVRVNLASTQTSTNKKTREEIFTIPPKEDDSTVTPSNKGLQLGEQQMLEWQMSQYSKRFCESPELHDLDNCLNSLVIEDNQIPEPMNMYSMIHNSLFQCIHYYINV